MRQRIGRLLHAIGHRLNRLADNCDPPAPSSPPPEPSLRERMAEHWARDRGDLTYRLEYELDANSTVFDLGGYEGQWTSNIFSKYGCNVFVFEPIVEYAQQIQVRFRQNAKIQVFPFGLGPSDCQLPISKKLDQSSVVLQDGEIVMASFREATQFITGDLGLSHVDLMKINIEGAEYDLLQHLIAQQWITNISNLQIQFHDFVPDAEARMKSIQERLALTHSLTYQYPFVWENWAQKE
jgi:FkbM family methyltransferase